MTCDAMTWHGDMTGSVIISKTGWVGFSFQLCDQFFFVFYSYNFEFNESDEINLQNFADIEFCLKKMMAGFYQLPKS